jgi:hypothetical protein
MCASHGFRVGPRVDIAFSDIYDITASRCIEWILWLIVKRRVWYIHAMPPSNSFSIARYPQIRNALSPMGVGKADQATT